MITLYYNRCLKRVNLSNLQLTANVSVDNLKVFLCRYWFRKSES